MGQSSFRSRPFQRGFILSALRRAFDRISTCLFLAYLITVDDNPTFVLPNSIFGISYSLVDPIIRAENRAALNDTFLSTKYLGYATICTIGFNWTNLLLFDLANQRQSGDEDLHNKPWRPIPSGRMSPTQMKHCLSLAVPLVLGFNHLAFGVGTESCLLGLLTWMYNDLGGGDDNWIIRNFIIACAFGVYNVGSVKVATFGLGVEPSATIPASNSLVLSGVPTVSLDPDAYMWATMISLVIFTTMHVQDLKDVKGDVTRGRKSAPVVLGRWATGWSIAIPVVLWSGLCPLFWHSSLRVAISPVVLGLAVAWRGTRQWTIYDLIHPLSGAIFTRDEEDHKQWRPVWSQGLSSKAVGQYLPRIQRLTEVLGDCILDLGEEGRKPLNVVEIMSWFAYDSMGEVIFGDDFGLLKRRCYLPETERQNRALAMMGPILNTIWVPRLAFTFPRLFSGALD
ncbi:UbiA prenyltransferase family-domain-containing protein [Clohesyomyces aquaticus]|uniref:UbiA prenyltransferase family-domain-containing protein n=1 Tax=Clohesyomyces aquaticus TaxID=1231657 RepID=A0A1Y1ZLI8_9PLEO|nr:UbiA prenyltransferase family-domain-containing protein [Clohesyomyces aquaticus]